MKLVEDHDAHAVERRIAMDASCQNAFGDDLDSRTRADARLATHAITDRFADTFTPELGHAVRSRARREASRLQQHDSSIVEPPRVEKRRWNQRCLTGSGRCLENEGSLRRERRPNCRQNGLDWKRQRYSA
jgi:hypothetical protein